MDRHGTGADEHAEPSLLLTKLLRLGLAGLAVAGVGLWLALFVSEAAVRPELWQRDWYCFYSAGESFLDAGAGAAYAEACIQGYFWLYPPYLLYPYALASLVPPFAYYGVAVAAIGGLTVGALGFLKRALGGASSSYTTLALFVLASAAFNATIVTGQHSAVLLFGLAGALWAFRDGRDVAAGLFLGLLGIKPNWAAIVVVWLIVARHWRSLGAMATVGGLMILSTFPMGVDAWMRYLEAAPRWIGVLLSPDASYPVHKLTTFEAFSRSTLGALSPSAGTAGWIVLELLALGACIRVWIRSSDVRRQIAMTVLALAAVNLYVEFYDALVLAVPAAVWWTGRTEYPKGSWNAIAVAAGAIWAWQWLSLYAFPDAGPPSLVGGLLLIWMAAELWRGR